MPSRFRALFTAALGLFAVRCHEPTAPTPITELPRELTAAEQQLVAADNRFAFRLFRQIADSTPPDSSLFISPLSVAMALTMTYNGAAGATEQEMAMALNVEGIPLDDLNASYRGLIDLLRGLDPRVKFQIANSIWYDSTWTFEQPFLDANRTYFDAVVRPLDFSSPAAARTINAWVSEHTQGKIPSIVEDPLPPDDVMYLINAIYFKGSWTQQFDKGRTRPAPFQLRDGSSATVPTMFRSEMEVRVAHTPDLTVLDLPYGGGPFTMTIVMPRDPAGLDSLVATLTQDAWNAWTGALDSAEVDVSLPKFRFSYAASLPPVLAALGMPHAFCDSGGPWTFTRMRATNDVCITTVKHKAFVDVNEEGTEAAAATAVGIGPTSAPPTVYVDRPFLFTIRENLSGTILFLGRVMRPTT
jgi:serine protease inhibitor